MSHDPRLDELEALANDPETDGGDLADLAEEIGSSIDGLRVLLDGLDRLGRSANPFLLGYVAFPFAKAPWDWEGPGEELNDVVLEFVQRAGQTNDSATLGGCCAALLALHAMGFLKPRSEGDRPMLGQFLLRCLDHPNWETRHDVLNLLHHLHADADLEDLLPATAIAALKQRLGEVAASDGGRFESLAAFLASLEGFYRDEGDVGRS